MTARTTDAARRLLEAHENRERFSPLPAAPAPRDLEEAYAVQDAFVALRADKCGAVTGYKVGLTAEAARRTFGLDSPVAGMMFESTVHRTPAAVRAADYLRLIVECEIAVEISADLPAADAPFFRDRVAQAVGGIMPAFEIVDDRCADPAVLARHPYDMIADNCFHEAAVLGYPIAEWQHVDLRTVRAEVKINGTPAGQGQGADVMGHPFDAVAWIADHLAAQGRGLLRGDVVITGCLIPIKEAKAGDLICLALEGLGEVELRVD